MSNGSKFNATGFNAGTSSLVLVSAAAAFTASATSDFTGGGYAKLAQAHMLAGAQANFSNGLKTSLLTANLIGASDTYFDPVAILRGAGGWDIQGTHDFNASVDLTANADFTTSFQFFANTEFRTGKAYLVSSANTFEAIANRVDFGNTNWSAGSNLVNGLEPQINGLMTGNWDASATLWTEPTVDRGLGYIEHESYGSLAGGANWDNQSFLTAIFTTGGFLSPSFDIEITGTKIIQAGETSWPITTELVMEPVSEQVVGFDLTISSDIQFDAVRAIWPSTAGWTGKAQLTRARPKMFLVGQWPLVNAAGLTATSTMRRAGRTNWTNTATLEFEEPIIWQRANVALTNASVMSAPAQKIRPGVMALESEVNATIVAEKQAYGFMDINGLGSTIVIAGALRLVDAPLARQFRIPTQNRTFIVPAKGKKFEVAA